MKWPFSRHVHGSTTVASPAEPRPETGGQTRRDWASIPPMRVAGGQPITLTAAPQAFVDGLATQQVLARPARLELIRRIDAPSGSLRGVLAAEVNSSASAGAEPRPPSPLPAAEHRRGIAVADEQLKQGVGPSPVDQLLAIDSGNPPAVPPRPEPEPGDASPAATAATTDRRPSLADSRRHGLGPAYHGPLPEAMRAERERGGEPEAVPGDLRSSMRDILGVDVGDRLVHRGPAVSTEAEAIGARAFARDGEVYISDDVGALDTAEGRATLAHELTHVAQQQIHGAPPDESSAAGHLMEAHAQKVEQYIRGDASATKPPAEMLHARPPAATAPAASDLVSSTQQMMRELVDSGFAHADGDGGIVFTMPPSSMTASGVQRQAHAAPTAATPAAEPGAAARHENWNPLETLGNDLAQGFGNDMLGIAGSFLGFSDNFMTEQRGELADANREFGRRQTRNAYTDLRMEHLRGTELERRHAEEDLFGQHRTTALDDETLHSIEQRVDREVNERMDLLEEQTAHALEQLNRTRAAANQTRLREVPDESYDTAFHQLFDHPESDTAPAAEALLAALTAATAEAHGAAAAGAAPHGSGAAGASAPGAAAGQPGGAVAGGASPTAGTAAARSASPSGATSPVSDTAHDASAHGSSPATGATGGHGAHPAEPEQPWMTGATMGGRFSAFGDTLLGDVFDEQLGGISSAFGFSDSFEQSIHDDALGHHVAASPAAAGSPAAAASGHPSGSAAAAAAAHPAGAAHGAVENITNDPSALDHLATRLYPNIRSRLRQELLIDRERAGLLADFR